LIKIELELVQKWDEPTQKYPISVCVIKTFNYKISCYKYKTILLCFVHKKHGFDNSFAVIESEYQEGHPSYTDYIEDRLYLFDTYQTAYKAFKEYKKYK